MKYTDNHNTDIRLDVEDEVGKLRHAAVAKTRNVEMLRKGR